MVDAPPESAEQDPALPVLDELIETLEDARRLLGRAADQARTVRYQRAMGHSFTDLVAKQPRPLVVEMLSMVQEQLGAGGSKWRRAEAQALRDEGLTTQAVANLFGVTRQRISALLGERHHPPRPPGRPRAPS